MSSHALLLRLFLSPSFFSVHVALRYLLLYSDNIGITYYLTYRLREIDVRELYEIWGFICHLLVTRPTKSRALESFIIQIAQQSTHIAMITLWFMQAALQDLSMSRRDSRSFLVCQSVLHKCHEIIFGDLHRPLTSPYANEYLTIETGQTRQKIKHHIEPTLVGLGVILAGAPGLPSLTAITGQIAIEQSRADEDNIGLRSFERNEDDEGTVTSSNSFSEVDISQDDVYESDSPGGDQIGTQDVISRAHLLHGQAISAARTVPALPLHFGTFRKSRASEDPLGQLDSEENSIPSRSSPSFSSSRLPLRSMPFDPVEALLERHSTQAQVQLLRSHYCLSEVQFLLNLESISNRLLVVPRPARVSALRAELTGLNHRLPAEVCMPMWCPSSDTPQGENGSSQPHHRIVRIPPGESVVLNSAERAPYLLLIEILNDNLEFEPTKRANKDVLRKIIMKELGKRGASRDLVSFGPSSKSDTQRPDDSQTSEKLSDVRCQETSIPSPTSANVTIIPNEEEEIDLVEQLYGAEKSLLSYSIDLSDSIVLRPTPKNKELDMVAWSRTSSVLSSPSLQVDASSFRTRSPASPALMHPTRFELDVKDQDTNRALSLDEYSERMRTAAIMLAQLNASLIRESVGPMGNSPQTFNNNQSTGDKHSRMKLQHSEATAIRDRIMKEMLALEEERMEHMRESSERDSAMYFGDVSGSIKSAEDESIIRRELNKADPSAVVFSESWSAKKSRIRQGSPYGHLSTWDCISVIVKTGGDLRQEQLAVQLIREFQSIWAEENCACWVKYFRILITGGTSGLVETITDAVSIHSIKKAEYSKRLAEGRFGHVTLFDYFKSTYGDPSSARFARAQRNFAKSLAGYSIVTYLLQVKDRHNGNILLDRDGHLIHIDFGFILSNTPGNIGFEAAPFKLPPEYIEVLGGTEGPNFLEFRRLFQEGFEIARKHCDRILTLVELMQKDSSLPCFAVSGEQTANQLRDRFQPTLTHALVGDYINRLIDSSMGSNWTRLYDSYQYYSQSIL